MLFYYHGSQDKKGNSVAVFLLKSSPFRELTMTFPVNMKIHHLQKTGLELLLKTLQV
jgi:hypothetical protein